MFASPIQWHKVEEDSAANQSSVSDFGDDNFAVGCWEQKEIISRDGQRKLQTQVFFASIDQRSEQAAGESACTALVAVIADWLHNNSSLMLIKSQFESLFREGSLEWRNLCENETYREQFPDKHFDLETVLQAQIRPISVVPGKSFIGFFQPDGAMSFDNIWEEISRAGTSEPQVYIVGWNDHFFILKVETETYYIIDTLGERLYEGCDQAYILKFDKDTTIYKLASTTQLVQEESDAELSAAAESKPCNAQQKNSEEDPVSSAITNGSDESTKTEVAKEIVCQGKESCKDYIKSFLASIPIRELQEDVKKGLITSTPLHHRFQIEFHFSHLQSPVTTTPTLEVTATVPQLPDWNN
ncbi:hypothetical protein HAX54_001214 [Datura stramonium]|uniref:Uncharacterized protein n=1 Tax=Datura stramonium TaxID=4076 RepID=A0ABS8T327_DATST|nr:hypothetical protein [Datura stramonium]